jgi:protein O-GlcNAc transferase
LCLTATISGQAISEAKRRPERRQIARLHRAAGSSQAHDRSANSAFVNNLTIGFAIRYRNRGRGNGQMNRKQRRAQEKQQGSATQRLYADALQHHAGGRLSDAEQLYREVLLAKPHHADSIHLLGVIAHQQGRSDSAGELIGKAIAINDNVAVYHSNLGTVLYAQGVLDGAVRCYRRAIDLKPDFPDALGNLGNALRQMGRLDEAVACYRKAVTLRPDSPAAHGNLGKALQERGSLDEAIISYRAAVALNADSSQAHGQLANGLQEQGQLDEAVACYRRALALNSNYPEAHNNLGKTLADQGWLEEAVTHLRMAVDLRPDYYSAYSNWLFIQNYLAYQPHEPLRNMARQFGVMASSHVGHAFTSWYQPLPGQPLRVGLVSSDLCNHPVGYFLESLLCATDPARIEFLAFPSHHREDELTMRIKPYLKAWEPIHALSNASAARLINGRGVQVLLDLAGHSAHNRLPMFAWRPAPVQASWLGYFATTGVAEIDYFIGDPQVLPVAESQHFTETAWLLPEIYYCFTPPAAPVEVSALPALSSGCVTFGCFNNLTKINDAVVFVWARVLHAVTGSRLMLKAKQLSDATVRENTRARFASHGIAQERLLLEAASSRDDYLRAYHQIDIALDPFPYPGGATSLEALWMGLPVLTKRGDRFLSHVGETIAGNAGLADWVAADEDDYVNKATQFAADLAHLSGLRARLRAQVLASPLFDAARFARHFEAAMWGMWERRMAIP